MELEVLGVGDAFSAVHYNTSFLIRARQLYLIDGPQGLFRLLRERNIDPADLANVVLTHIHGDHSSGIETLLLWRRSCGLRTSIYTSPAIFHEFRERVFPRFQMGFSEDLRAIQPKRLSDYASFMAFAEDTYNKIEADLCLEIRHNWHPTPTLGIRLVTPNGRVGLSGDTCFRPALLNDLYNAGVLSDSRFRKLSGQWLWDCDLVYHEVQPDDGPVSHTRESDLLELPADVRSRIRLVHVSDDYRPGPIPVAVEGERVVFNSKGPPELRLP